MKIKEADPNKPNEIPEVPKLAVPVLITVVIVIIPGLFYWLLRHN